jgi:nucleotide-binding universal stress UspA family protein
MNAIRKSILLAVDGSDRSLDAVRYASKLLNPENTHVVLFHVMWKIDQGFWDMGINPMGRQQMAGIRSWEANQVEKAQSFMERAQDILLGEGFPRESVTMILKDRKENVACDIISESRKGRYDAVLSGRRGLGEIEGLILGSVANKLVDAITHTPVSLVGNRAGTEKILLGIDASEAAMRAVNFTGALLGGRHAAVTLVHIVRGLRIFRHEARFFSPSEQEALIQAGEKNIVPVFDAARKQLINAGFEADKIDTWTITDFSSRAEALVHQAREKGYGTIIIGRKGLSNAEFPMGRVCRKVVQMSKGIAVWVIS